MQRNPRPRRPLRTMSAAGIFLGAILIGGLIAIATGVIATVGLLQMLRGAGLHHEPPISATSITARQRAVDARLRARYLQRHPRSRPPDFAAPEPVNGLEPVPSLDPQPGSLIGALVNRLAG